MPHNPEPTDIFFNTSDAAQLSINQAAIAAFLGRGQDDLLSGQGGLSTGISDILGVVNNLGFPDISGLLTGSQFSGGIGNVTGAIGGLDQTLLEILEAIGSIPGGDKTKIEFPEFPEFPDILGGLGALGDRIGGFFEDFQFPEFPEFEFPDIIGALEGLGTRIGGFFDEFEFPEIFGGGGGDQEVNVEVDPTQTTTVNTTVEGEDPEAARDKAKAQGLSSITGLLQAIGQAQQQNDILNFLKNNQGFIGQFSQPIGLPSLIPGIQSGLGQAGQPLRV